MIDAANWKEHAAGLTGDEVLRDGEFVRVPLMLMDKAAIAEWSDGKRELSMGYTMDLKIIDGETPDGQKYDAIQTNLRMNHLALVSRARGGSKLTLGDFKIEDSNMSDVKLTTITVDGLSVETTEPGAQAISKLMKDLADAHKATVDAAEAHKATIAGKDAELATKDAEIDTLKGKQMSDADIDQRVNDRADLIAVATSIAAKDYTGKSDDDIRKMAVVAVLGQDAIEDKSPEYITARFDILSEEATQDGVRRVLKTGATVSGNNVEKAHSDMVSHLTDAWKQEAA
jgi:hypothetical protein